jgi:hypothetical protein
MLEKIDLVNSLWGVVMGIVGWVLGVRKRNADDTSAELENVQKAIVIYRKMLEDMKKVEESLLEQLTELKRENKELRSNKTCK